MSKRCDICDRGPVSSQTRSHSNIASKRRLLINLQVTRSAKGVRQMVCTKCKKVTARNVAHPVKK